MNNVKFSTSLHIMTLLAYQQDEILSSDYMASSININPAIVRKEISNLKKYGLIESKEGKGGGNMLGKSAKKIFLSDIYEAVSSQKALGKTNNPSPECPVGRQINKHLTNLYSDVEATLIKKLGKISLNDFIKQFK